MWEVAATLTALATEALDEIHKGTYVRRMPSPSSLTDERLDSLYDADGFGGEKTMRAKVIRDLIDEIRALRNELTTRSTKPRQPSNDRYS